MIALWSYGSGLCHQVEHFPKIDCRFWWLFLNTFMCCRLKNGYVLQIENSIFLLHIENAISFVHKRFNMCCKLKIRDVLHIENISSPLSSFAHQLTFPLATHRHRRRSLFWLSTRQKNNYYKKCQLKVSIPKNSTQIINYQLLLFPLHSVAASRRSLLCPSWDVNIAGDASSPGTILILWLGRVVNPTEWNWYCTIWKVWPIVADHCEHWKQSLA